MFQSDERDIFGAHLDLMVVVVAESNWFANYQKILQHYLKKI
jgi:hypothetical protein